MSRLRQAQDNRARPGWRPTGEGTNQAGLRGHAPAVPGKEPPMATQPSSATHSTDRSAAMRPAPSRGDTTWI
ncbi:hypothetical protein GCM10010442_73460 [Kitasatospora kifunensis]